MALPVQESTDVPEPLRLVMLSTQDMFVEFVVTASVTVPVKPLIGETMMVETPRAPGLVVTVVGVAVTLKSCTW